MDSKRIEQIYQGLDMLEEIDLVPDPVPLGPKYIHEKVSECRNQISKVEEWLLEINRAESATERLLHATQAEYDIESDNLLVTDKDVARLRSVDERKALVKVRLKGIMENIKNTKLSLNDLKFLRKSVELKLKNLEKLNSDIRLQYQAIKAEIDLANKWGRTGEDDESETDDILKPKKAEIPEPDAGESEAVMKAIEGLGSSDPTPDEYEALVQPEPDTKPAVKKAPVDEFADLLPGVKTNFKVDSEPDTKPAPEKKPEPPVDSQEDESNIVGLFANLGNGDEPVPESWGSKHSIENQPTTGDGQAAIDDILDNLVVTEPEVPKEEPENGDVDYASILDMAGD